MRYWRLLGLLWLALEITAVILVAGAIGWGWTIALLLAAIPIGFIVMKSAAVQGLQELQASVDSRRPPDEAQALRFVGGVLIALPGLCSDLVGLALLIPVVRRLIGARARRWVEARFSSVRMFGFSASEDVIKGTVIYPDDPSGPDQTGPVIER